jgi:protoheme IX farnesyltransferase
MWTPPHFWALALVKNDDYKAANIPMLPVVAGSFETRRQIVIYAVLLAPLAVMPSFIGMASVGYGVIAALAGLLFVAMSLQLFKTGDHKHAMRLFAYSIMYLFLLFLGLVIDNAVLGYLAGAA